MKVEYIKLSEYNVAFKQLISGPAPVGRILNYLIMTGNGVLRHKNGNRDLTLKDNIASAYRKSSLERWLSLYTAHA